MDWSPHDSGEVMFTYPESNPHQFHKTGAIVVLHRPQWMHPTMVLHEMLIYSISSCSQLTLDHDNTNEVANDGMHPLLQTIHAMPAAYREIIGVCQQLPPLSALQSLANEISDGMVTVATDGSVQSGNSMYSWIIDGLHSGVHLAGHAKAAQTGQDPTSMQMEVLGHLSGKRYTFYCGRFKQHYPFI
jgi:predicted heme/steroid binding protein